MSNFLEPVAGFGRTMSRTAAAMALDLASGAVRLGEAATDTVNGRRRAPGVLRVQVVILRDEHGEPLCTPAAVEPALRTADHVLRTQAGARVRVVDVRTVDEIPPAAALDPRANRELVIDDILGRTDFYRRNLAVRDAAVGPGLVGAPITVIVVRNIGGNTTGCSLGISADWVIAQSALFDARSRQTYDETVLAHELAHALNLPHHRDQGNLMFPASSPPDALRGTALTSWQRGVIQANRHVVPGLSDQHPDLG